MFVAASAAFLFAADPAETLKPAPSPPAAITAEWIEQRFIEADIKLALEHYEKLIRLAQNATLKAQEMSIQGGPDAEEQIKRHHIAASKFTQLANLLRQDVIAKHRKDRYH